MKEKKGTVVRAKMEKTRIVAIEYRTQHKVYKKVQTKKR
jgi:ribosomal protein S17